MHFRFQCCRFQGLSTAKVNVWTLGGSMGRLEVTAMDPELLTCNAIRIIDLAVERTEVVEPAEPEHSAGHQPNQARKPLS